MKRMFGELRSVRRLMICLSVLVGLFSVHANWPPRIDFIQPFLGDLVLIHFDIAPNLYYQIQYTETLTPSGTPGGSWTNLLNQPIYRNTPDHFVAIDTRLRPQRFYRLLVYP